MKNLVVALEVSHKFVKIVIGDLYNGKVALSYVKKVPLGHFIEGGYIKDKESLIGELVKLNPLVSREHDINELLDNVILVLPPLGAQMFQTNTLNTVMSVDKIIEQHDILNIYNIIRNKKLPNEDELVNIIINTYKLDNGEVYSVAPIGKYSASVVVNAKVVTLPHAVSKTYIKPINAAGIKVKQRVVSSLSAVELLKEDPNTPNEYFLVDFGANMTNVSLISNKEAIATRSFIFGSDRITEKLIEKFNISEAQAEKIKILYGIDSHDVKFTNSIIGTNINRNELNDAIKTELKEFVSLLNSTMEQITTSYHCVDKTNLIPLIFIGGGSKLIGLKDYLKDNMNNRDIEIVSPKTIGGRDPSLFGVIGAISLYRKYLSQININANADVSRDE